MSQKKSISNWINEQKKDGKELKIVWDGGGDSGWVEFRIDNNVVENEYTDALVDHMHNTLDYGSWAGEFHSSGEAYFNYETNQFTGEDNYSEDQNDVLTTNIEFSIPKDVWFDILRIECECNYDEPADVSVRILVKNGFTTERHASLSDELQEELKRTLTEAIDDYQSDEYEFRSCFDEWIFERSEGVDAGDVLIFKIDRINIGVMSYSGRNIVLELDEDTLEQIDYQLNLKNERE